MQVQVRASTTESSIRKILRLMAKSTSACEDIKVRNLSRFARVDSRDKSWQT